MILVVNPHSVWYTHRHNNFAYGSGLLRDLVEVNMKSIKWHMIVFIDSY